MRKRMFTELISITYFYSFSHVYNNTVGISLLILFHFFFIVGLFFIHKWKKKAYPCRLKRRRKNVFIAIGWKIFLFPYFLFPSTPSFNTIIPYIFSLTKAVDWTFIVVRCFPFHFICFLILCKASRQDF